MSEQNKPKRKLFKKVLKVTGITFLLLLVALIVLPIIYKDKIKDLALTEVNKFLKADVEIDDFDLTFISTFPNMSLVFEGVRVTGRNEFQDVELLNMKKFRADLNLWDVISGDDIKIKSLYFNNMIMDVRVLPDGTANYDIVISDEDLEDEDLDDALESSPFNLALQHIELNNAKILYDDKAYNMSAKLIGLNFVGDGDISSKDFEFKTNTNVDALSYRMDGLNYLTNVKTDLLANILISMKEDDYKFTLKENELKLNNFKAHFDGYYQMLATHDDINLKFSTDNSSFKDLLSLIPSFYLTGYESMLTSGDIKMNGFLKGRMDDVNLPAFDFTAKVDNGSVNYPDLPGKIDKMEIDFNTSFPGGADFDKMKIDLNKFNVAFLENMINANLHLTKPMSDPNIKSKVIAKMDLSKVKSVIPFEEGEDLNGKLDADIEIIAKMSDIDNERYENVNAKGGFNLYDFLYASSDLDDKIEVSSVEFLFEPKALKLNKFNAKYGVNDLQMDGTLTNHFGYMLRDEKLKGNLNFNSNYLDVNTLMPASEEEAVATEEVSSDSPSSADPVLIPENIDFVLTTNIKKLKYEDIDINNIKGRVVLRDKIASLNGLTMDMLGGKVLMNGAYNTQNAIKPKVDFSYDIENVDVKGLADNFISIEKLAPIAKHARGNISSRFNVNCEVTPSFEPIYNTLTGEGDLRSNSIRIENAPSVERIAGALEMKNVKLDEIRNLNIRFKFENGKVNVNPFNIRMGGIDTRISGSTAFTQEIDYDVKMNIPKSMIPQELIGIVEKGISQAEKIPGFKLKGLPDIIDLNLKVVNTVLDPKVEGNIRNRILELGSDVKSSVRDAVDDKINEIKDSAKAIVNEKVDEVKEDVRENLQQKRDELINSAQKQADKITSEAKVLADKTRAEAKSQADKIIDEAGSNPLKKRAAEIAAQKVIDNGEKAATKIESEAQQRADNIMNDARSRADAL